MDNRYIKIIGMVLMCAVLVSCTDDLDRFPTNGLTGDVQFSSLEGYAQGLATIYGVANNNGKSWEAGLLRPYFALQEAPTDETVHYWTPISESNWSVENGDILKVYRQLVNDISYANNFIIETGKASSRGLTEFELEQVATYASEARFLRAWYYWMLLDLFGNPPFATENTLASGEIPRQIQSADLFTYIESELLAIEGLMVAPGDNEYGRVDRAAAWALLARLYLNAEVYTSNPYYTEAITFSEKVINAGYSLESDYSWLTLADNHLNTNEVIFSIPFDNGEVITWQGTNFFALGQAGVPEEINGMSGTWNLFAFRPNLVDLFPSEDNSIDSRAMFYTDGRTKEVTSISDATQGYSGYKYRNINRDGSSPVQNNRFNNISDIDFPVIRLAEIYLIYAEAVLRGGTGGDQGTALTYINTLRERAYGNTDGNISSDELDLDFILDERARELYWECHRRTDLVRHGKFTSANYLWPLKGGLPEGKGLPEHFNIYPLPNSDVQANPYLEQNPGY